MSAFQLRYDHSLSLHNATQVSKSCRPTLLVQMHSEALSKRKSFRLPVLAFPSRPWNKACARHCMQRQEALHRGQLPCTACMCSSGTFQTFEQYATQSCTS